ncbi:MAG: PIN domain-containing protein [Gammaproteobacteria bacterium]|nr:PIN domain-containing protein [Gammaproteobacteria bacterium]
MSTAYLDTSVLTVIAFDEPGAAAYARQLDDFARLISSNLLEAELRAAFARENLVFQESAVAGIEWILPDRTLAPEYATVLEAGYLRGADLWHVTTALYVSPRCSSLWFVTLDARQGAVAEALGFPVPEGVRLP